jgi:serine/threonine protein kinase
MAVHQPNTEPLPGYRLLEPLGKGGFGEVWKCEAPGGLVKAIKFVAGQTQEVGDAANGAVDELRALQHIKSIRHPFLLSMDRVEIIDGNLIVVMELADRSLHDLLQEYNCKGQPGIPRAELLGYMHEAAEVLDLMNQEHHLQHLDIKPRNLFLVGRHVKVADFGLVNSVAEMNGGKPTSLHLGAITPTYAAPESFLGTISSSCDQYSLAVAYHELLTGKLPFNGKNFRQLAMQHMQTVPDLNGLPESDRAAVARALAKDPKDRFPTCDAFVQGLLSCMRGETEQRVPARMFFALDSASPQAKPTTVHALKPGPTNDMTVAPSETRPMAPSAPVASSMEFAGLQLLECMNRQFGSELWRGLTKDGKPRLVRFVPSTYAEGADGDPFARLAQFKHAGLAKMEMVRDGPNRVGLITEAGDHYLGTRLKECTQASQPGIPRQELLDYLASAAAALDDLYEEYSVPHLTVSPRTMALVNGKARLLDFGLAALCWVPAGQQPGALNTRYSAPELFDGTITRQADQYSLALLFQEMLTGAHAFRSLNPRQMASSRQRGTPDLGTLPIPDRVLVLRALHRDPKRRFASCSEFIEALSDVATTTKPTSATTTARAATVIRTTKAITPLRDTPVVSSSMQAVNELIAVATKGREIRECNGFHYLLQPGKYILHHFYARLIQGTTRIRLHSFRDQWRAKLIERKGNEYFLFRLLLTGNLWQRTLGRQPCLALELHCEYTEVENVTVTEIEVKMRPEACSEAQAVNVLEDMAPQLLESLRQCLEANPERRNQVRMPYEQAVQVAPVFEGALGDAIESRTRDISQRGMSVLMPRRPLSGQVCVLVPLPSRSDPASIMARVVHVRSCQDGRFEIGLAFA